MNDIKLEPGLLAYSKSGRDSGRYYIITLVSEGGYVQICDGKYRTLAKPKKKKLKHLRINGYKFESIAEKLKAGRQVFDSEIYSALRPYNEKQDESLKTVLEE